MLKVNVRADFSAINQKLKSLSSDIERKVIPAALNKVGAKAKVEMSRAIADEFNLPRSEINSRLKLTRAGRKFTQWLVQLDPFASRRFGRSLNLIRFMEKKVTLAEGKRRKKAGTQNQLHFQIKKAGGKKIITGAFIGNKGRTVFVRQSDARLPIKALSTIDVPQMFNTRLIRSRVEERIRKELVVEFDRAIKAVTTGILK